MKYVKAKLENLEELEKLIADTIKNVYPKYYTQEAVDYFLSIHNAENIKKDIELDRVRMLYAGDQLIATGSREDNHIKRIFVNANFQKKGYGSYVIQQLEDEIAREYDEVYVDASLMSSIMYERRGYTLLKHKEVKLENDCVLVYEVMRKNIFKSDDIINYDGKVFCIEANSANGDVTKETLFYYHQKGDVLWAEYSGGNIIKGNIVGVVSDKGIIDFNFQHINAKKEVKTGVCHSVPNMIENGKLELAESWQLLSGDKSKGESRTREI